MFCSPILCENFRHCVGFNSAPADLQTEVKLDQFHRDSREFRLTGKSLEDQCGAHLHNSDLNHHVRRQIQFGLETFHHGNQQMNGGR